MVIEKKPENTWFSNSVSFLSEYIGNYNKDTSLKAIALKISTVILGLFLLNDFRHKYILQGTGHLFCLGITAMLHKTIYAQELSELVPTLAHQMQYHKKTVEKLEEMNTDLQKSLRDFQGLSDNDLSKRQLLLQEHTAQLNLLEKQRAAQEKMINDMMENMGAVVQAHKINNTEQQALLAAQRAMIMDALPEGTELTGRRTIEDLNSRTIEEIEELDL